MTTMTDSRAAEVLAAHNEWRRGGDGQATDPTTLGLALDIAIARLRDPAEAQAQGGGEVVAHGFYDPATGAYSETQRTPRWLPAVVCTSPPSAPVGVEDKARAMFEAQADELAAPWDRQWEPTKDFWRKRAAEALAQQPAAPTCRAKPFTPGAKIEWDGSSFLLSGWYFDGGDLSNAPMDFVRAVLSHIEQHCETGQSAKKNLHDVMTPAQQPAAVDGAMERTKWRCAFCGGAYYLPSPSGRFCCEAQAKFRAAQPGGEHG